MSISKKLNFIWFTTDQQRYDTIASLGNKYIKTPNLDKLVNEGVAFINTYAQNPVCTPSRASFLTGRYPQSTGVRCNGNDYFPDNEILVTRMLSDAGYKCGLVGKLHLSGAQGRMEKRTNDGYSFFKWSHHPHNDWEDGLNDYQNWLKSKGIKWEEKYKGKYLNLNTWPPIESPNFSGKEVGIELPYHQTTWCVEEAMNFIEQNSNKPWSVSINTFDPHPPFDPPQKFKDKIDYKKMPLPLWKDGELDNKPAFHLDDYLGENVFFESTIGITNDAKREKVRDYYAMVEVIDNQLGILMDFIEEKGIKGETVIIFMSDHGEMAGDHGIYGKGPYFYEGAVRVPLIISCPGTIQSGIKSSALVELVDITPTILELAGIEIPNYIQGKSLASILKGEANPDFHKNAVSCEYFHSLLGNHEVNATMHFDGRYKIIVHHGFTIGELYDLKYDPCEYENQWSNIEYRTIKHELIKRCFDNAILNNLNPRFDPILKY